MNELISQISPQHFILAYVGMFLHILMKLSELSKTPDFSIGKFVKKNIYTMIATFIMIPLLLIMAKEEAIKSVLPINNVTAVLAGWQTNSLFKTVMSLFGKKSQSNSSENLEMDAVESPEESDSSNDKKSEDVG